jgi:nucleotide-binding universal stress UspA family protein
MYKKILIPTDGSENSKRANKHALWIADKSGADIIVLYVVDPHYPRIAVLPISTLPTPDEHFFEEIRTEGKEIIEDFKQELEDIRCEGKCKNVNLKTLIREGNAYIEILKVVEEENIELVVMGASGKHGLDRFVLGSVTERVVRASKKPVMVVP